MSSVFEQAKTTAADAYNRVRNAAHGASNDLLSRLNELFAKNASTVSPEDVFQEPVDDDVTNAPREAPLELPNDDGTIESALNILRVEAMHIAEQKARKMHFEIRAVEAKTKSLNDLGQIITSCTKEDGILDLSQHEQAKDLLDHAKKIGVVVPKNTTLRFEKTERDALLKNIASKQKDLEVELRQKTSDMQEALRIRNEIFAILKSLLEKLHHLGSLIAKNIAGR